MAFFNIPTNQIAENVIETATHVTRSIRRQKLAVSPPVRAELQALQTTIQQFKTIEPVYYKLLETRTPSTTNRGNDWQNYVTGIKLQKDKLAQWHDKIMHDVPHLLQDQPENTEGLLVRSNLQAFLAEMNISLTKATEIFQEKITLSLYQLLNHVTPAEDASARTMTSEPITGSQRRFDVFQEDEPLFLSKPEVTAEVMPFHNRAAVTLSEQGTEVIPVAPKRRFQELQQITEFLQQLLSQARRYAPGLVAILEYYLTLAQGLTEESEVEQQKTVDKEAITEVLAGLNLNEVMKQITVMPVYLHQAQAEDRALRATAILPQFQNQTLNNGYHWLWQELLTDARRQLLQLPPRT